LAARTAAACAAAATKVAKSMMTVRGEVARKRRRWWSRGVGSGNWRNIGG
jgi:hypothetical protein